MANQNTVDLAEITTVQPAITRITLADLREVLARGYDDFKEWPTHLLLMAIIYPIIGLVLARLTFGYDVLPLLFPISAGFALIAPVAALGLYELSRRRELGLEASWASAFNVRRSPSIRAIERLGLVLLAVFFIWLFTAQNIYTMIFGDEAPTSLTAFATQVFTTDQGWRLIIIGSGVGFLFALGVFSTIVVSFPLLLDREVSALTAVQTSIRVVLANPVPMAVWGLIIAAGLVLGSLPFFFGLAIVMPILGHATWHLYRKVVEH